jgi:hypothetical protein
MGEGRGQHESGKCSNLRRRAVGAGSLIATLNANLLRNDLPFPDQNHGFFYTFVGAAQISDGNSHLLYVYAVDATGDPNTLLHPAGSL